MKRILSFLLVTAMLLSLLAGIVVTAGAEETYTYISDVYHSVNGKPKTLEAGKPLPELKPYSSDPGEYTIECAWLDEEENELPAGTITEYGKTYCIRAKVYPQEGYAFEKDCWIGGYDNYYTVGTLGDGAAELWGDKYYTAWKAIEKVEITLTEPKVGEALQVPEVVSGEAIIDESFWYAYGENDERVENGSLAQAGHRYEITLNLKPKEGYIFTEATQLFLNGVLTSIYDVAFVSVYKTYDLRIVLDALDFQIAETVVGQPFPQAVVAEDVGYTARTTWTDMYTDSEVVDAEVKDGGIYLMDVTLELAESHKLADEIKLTVNGEEPDGYYYYGNNYSGVVECSRVVSFAQELEKVEVTYAEPVEGEAPGEISVPEGAHYSVGEDTYWVDWEAFGEPVERFEKGKKYELNLYVTPEVGYAVTDNTQFYVNGEKIEEYDIQQDWTYIYTCMEYSFKTAIEKVELPALPELKVGDPLPTGSGTGENYTYEIRVKAEDKEGNNLSGSTVVEGATYYVDIIAYPDSGCVFAKDVAVTVGGGAPSRLCDIQADMIREMQVYSFGGYKIVEEINLSATVPWIGQSKGGAITCADDAGYKVTSAMWGVSPNGDFGLAEDLTDPLEAGQHVMMQIVLYTEVGYALSSNVKMLVNGQEVCVSWITGNADAIYAILDLGEAAAPPDYNGLVVVDGVWGFYVGGILQEDYTGLVPYGDMFFYVENGILDFTYTGLAWYNDAWHYVANSQLTEGYTGLVWFEGEWFYTVNSIIDWTFTGLVPFEGNMFYVQNNHLDWGYTGLAYLDGGWCYVESALLKPNFTGLTYFNDNWFYVVEGKVDWTFTGMVPYAGNYFYVQNNLLDWSYTGLGYHEGNWYYFQSALYNTTFVGLVPFNGALFYVRGGTIDWSYNGEAVYNETEYSVINGVVQL